MKSLHLVRITAHGHYATITADIKEITSLEAMLDNDFMKGFEQIALARGCSTAYKLEVTYSPSRSVRMYLNIMGENSGKVISDILSNG